MLLYLLFWAILGFIIHFYIVFGTNLLTRGPAQNCCFCLFQCFEETEYQTESKRNETFGNMIFSPNVIQETWTLLQEVPEAVTRVEGAPHLGAPPTLWAPRSSTGVLLPPIYTYVSPNDQNRSQKPNSTAAPSVPMGSHLGACSGAPPEEASITEGFYINTIAPPMKCE